MAKASKTENEVCFGFRRYAQKWRRQLSHRSFITKLLTERDKSQSLAKALELQRVGKDSRIKKILDEKDREVAELKRTIDSKDNSSDVINTQYAMIKRQVNKLEDFLYNWSG